MYDVVVIGGGAAGLSGAVALGRARRSVLVVDAGEPRNAPAEGVHVFLSREGVPPAELLAAGRAEVARYGGEVATGEVVAATRREDAEGGGFAVELRDGTIHHARRLLVTTGLVDELPSIPGLAERWGEHVLHCPYCHGWEVRDEPVAVLATGALATAVHQALLWRQWTDRVTLVLPDAEPGGDDLERLTARDVTVVRGKVAAVEDAPGGVAVRLADGTAVQVRAVVAGARLAARAAFVDSLGLTTSELEWAGQPVGTHLPTDATGATAVPGVWAAGNVTNPMDQVIAAAAGGVRAAAAINADLIEEETRRAVLARRG
ncbi:NAD(P)/FAD-dependent oxidoreductase [Actinomadura atramentaria]|uniref:NAD(P)/FAD-dependent oxidoreductase n=1 Tax=Actinomadura atramentaria TaxID=1990 RepID=UPI00037EA84D|nr:NAD(P)/FAD-dependent oxidoreductase [Actinomadura atramentaria]